MSVDIVVPQIGEAVAELTLVDWHKQVGDRVTPGEVLFDVDSDKAIVEVEAFEEGILAEILAPAGSAVMPQQVVGRLQTVREAVPAAPTAPAPASAPEAAGEATSAVSPVAQRIARELNVDVQRVPGSGPGGRVTADDVRRFAEQAAPPFGNGAGATAVVASPKARRLARERDVDLRALAGSGVDGMIIAADVERAQPRAGAGAMAPPTADGPTTELGRLRSVIAARTTQSKQDVPHFYLMADVNMAQASALRQYCTDTLGWAKAPTYTDIIVRACALALRDDTTANRHFTPAGMVAHDAVSIGVAVATDAGLTVPVVPNADRLSLQATSQAVSGLAERARQGRLKPADLSAKSMVVSNLGMYGVDAFVAIIDIPDPMILAVGRVADRVVPVNGQVAIQPMCTLTLSIDHRALDGAQGAIFLGRVKKRLENPFEILGAAS